MDEIKSAFEIAMERMENVKSDKSLLEAHDYKEKGKRIASAYLNEPGKKETEIGKNLKEFSGKQKEWVREGIFETLLNNVVLPIEAIDEDRVRTIEKGMQVLLPDKRFVSSVFQQILQFFNQYIQTKEQIHEQLESQFSQKLRQKDQELSGRLGTDVHLDPEQDPEFAAYFKQHISELSAQYQEALDQGKEELRKMFQQTR
jgi:hypothetical protein